jgi:hypothetical protein
LEIFQKSESWQIPTNLESTDSVYSDHIEKVKRCHVTVVSFLSHTHSHLSTVIFDSSYTTSHRHRLIINNGGRRTMGKTIGMKVIRQMTSPESSLHPQRALKIHCCTVSSNQVLFWNNSHRRSWMDNLPTMDGYEFVANN